jgi:hypothetical protein
MKMLIFVKPVGGALLPIWIEVPQVPPQGLTMGALATPRQKSSVHQRMLLSRAWSLYSKDDRITA